MLQVGVRRALPDDRNTIADLLAANSGKDDCTGGPSVRSLAHALGAAVFLAPTGVAMVTLATMLALSAG